MNELFKTQSRSIPITKEMVWKAYCKVNSNKGSAGVDEESLINYQANLSKNLYKLWNRMTSGSYFPQPVLEVEIPKVGGGIRKLGIPTVNDRIAQEVIKTYVEPRLEAEFHEDSYGYRPNKNTHQALDKVRKNVKQYNYVIDMDIKSFFDEVDHELLLKALEKHVSERWVLMYIKRWLEIPIQTVDGLVNKQGKGTLQGGVISPLLANLFMHYVLDKWIEKHFPYITFVRYADDVVVHCYTEEQTKSIYQHIKQRLTSCNLRLSEEKTKIVYCKDYKRKENNKYPKKFDFLGYTFKPTSFKSKTGTNMYVGYECKISQKAQSQIIQRIRDLSIMKRTDIGLQEIAVTLNPKLRGIVRYYGYFHTYSLQSLLSQIQFRIMQWVRKKFKRFRGSYNKSYNWLNQIKESYPTLFYHWQFL